MRNWLKQAVKDSCFLGMTEEEVRHEQKVRNKFPEYDKWAKINFDGENSVKDLLYKLVEIIERPDHLQSNFVIIPTEIRCEEETTVAVMIDDPISPDSEVKAVVKGNEVDFNLPCQRLNPHSYRVTLPKSEIGEATIYIEVDGYSLGSQAKVIYKSYLPTDCVTAVNELYCHCLDVLCKLIHNQKAALSDEVDQRLSEIFDYMVNLPAAGFENLFGIYQYYTEEHSRTEVPTIVHLAAKYDLKETVARLQELPQFFKVCCITNKQNKRPEEVAAEKGNKELAAYLQDFQSQMEAYSDMCYVHGYVQKGYYNTKQGKDAIEAYGTMDLKKGNQLVYAVPSIDRPHLSSFPQDPSENYLPMSGGIGGKGKPGQRTSDAESESYEPVDEWKAEKQKAGYQDGAPETTVTGKQQELIAIQNKFKDGIITQDKVAELFNQWQKEHSSSNEPAKSFKERQELMKVTKQELTQHKGSPGFFTKFLTKKKKKGSVPNTQIEGPLSPGSGKSEIKPEKPRKPSFKSAVAHPPIQPKAAYVESSYVGRTESSYASREPTYTSREPPAPPVPSRDIGPAAIVKAVQPTRSDPKGDGPPDDYLVVVNKTRSLENEEEYDYVPTVEWKDGHTYPSHNHTPPPEPPEEHYADMDKPANSRLSGASTGSRASSMSSGRASTVSQSSGIDVQTSEDDLHDTDMSDEYYLSMDNSNRVKTLKQTYHEGFGSRDSGLHTIGENTEYQTEEYDPVKAKRLSIQDKALPEPPAVPLRTQGRRPPPVPMSPATPDFTETSIPLEAPPPIPGQYPQFPPPRSNTQEKIPEPATEDEEEDTEAARKAKFLLKIGATKIFGGPSGMPAPVPPSKPWKRPPTAPKPS